MIRFSSHTIPLDELWNEKKPKFVKVAQNEFVKENPKETLKVPVELLGDTVAKLKGYKQPLDEVIRDRIRYKVWWLDEWIKVSEQLQNIIDNLLFRFKRMEGFIDTQAENVMPSVYSKQKQNWGTEEEPESMYIWKWRASYIQFIKDEKMKYAEIAQTNQAIREYLKSLDSILSKTNLWDKRHFKQYLQPNKKY